MARRVLMVAVIAAFVGAGWAAPSNVVGALTVARTEAVAAQADPSPFGAWAEPTSGMSRTRAVQNLETSLGAELGVVSNYLHWNSSFPTELDRSVRDSGKRLMLAVKLKESDGSRPRWRDLADSRPGDPLDTQLRNWAVSIREFGAPVYFAFHKEPEEPANLPNGTAADYRAAWARVVSVFRGEGATNAEFVFAMTDNAYGLSSTDRRSVSHWYPGDAVVDHIGASGMNWFGCEGLWRSWRSFEQIFEPMRRWATAHPDKGLIAFEFGSVEDPLQPGRKAAWIDDARRVLTRSDWDRFVAHSYYNGGSPQAPECNWRLDTSESSRQAASSWASGATAPVDPPVRLPSGSFDRIDVDGRKVVVRGRANDPDGRPVYRVSTTWAGDKRYTFERQSTPPTFATSFTAQPGDHRVCVTLLDNPTRQPVGLGCKNVTVK